MGPVKMYSLDVIPDTSLLAKLGQTNFTVPSAIEEFVDNSYDARSQGQSAHVSIVLDSKSDLIEIADDSVGMDLQGLQNALTIAAPKHSNDSIGLFGFGLKAAASYLARNLVIETSQAGSTEALRVEYDSDSLKSWTVEATTSPKASSEEHGTRIHLSGLRVAIDAKTVASVKFHIGEIYHRFLADGRLKVTVDGEEISAPEWLLLEGLRWDIDLTVNGKKVTGWLGAGVPKSRGGTVNYTPGFYLYRRDRVVRSGEWIGIRQHSAVRTLVGELNLDEFPVNNNKTDFLRGTSDWVALEEAIEAFLDSAYEGTTVRQKIYHGIATKRHKPVKLPQGTRVIQAVQPSQAKPELPKPLDTPTPEQPTKPPIAVDQPTEKEPAKEDPILDRPREEIKRPVVFIVHGRDEEAREQCEDMLRSMDLEPVVLKDRPAGGIISLLDKIEKYAKASDCAVILLTPDDYAWCPLKGESSDKARPRARQNVVFEFGYFVRWSRKRTFCLMRVGCDLERPTDVNGIHYIPFEEDVHETKEMLRKELVECGILAE